ncbi:MAG: GHKL domain-containing protein [Clostridia bacterium]|nr:GHKL domain-containing protein [Clostridia bacterium]
MFLAIDSIPRFLYHIILERFDDYMILSAQHPIIALCFILVCFAINLLSIWLLRKVLHPERGSRFVSIKLMFMVFIMVPVMYMGNIQYFLPFDGSQTPLNVSLIRILLCYFGLASIAAIDYGLRYRENQRENEFIRRLMKEQHRQHQLRQNTIDELNRECHDLKHQLALMHACKDFDVHKVFAQRMEAIVRGHESIVQTGNSVLDLILTEKQSVCQKKSIRLTYMVDPNPLEALSPIDVCTIFDNALENAIEASAEVNDAQRRIINLKVTQKSRLMYIHIENYFEHSLRWKEGELMTTKSSINYHGFGLKSIRYAISQYDGHMNISTRDNWFRVDIVIPLPVEGAQDFSGKTPEMDVS